MCSHVAVHLLWVHIAGQVNSKSPTLQFSSWQYLTEPGSFLFPLDWLAGELEGCLSYPTHPSTDLHTWLLHRCQEPELGSWCLHRENFSHRAISPALLQPHSPSFCSRTSWHCAFDNHFGVLKTQHDTCEWWSKEAQTAGPWVEK